MKLDQLVESSRIFLRTILHDLENGVLNPGFFNRPTYRNYLKTKYDEFMSFFSLEGMY